MSDAAPEKPEHRNNLWPSIRTVEAARLETAMGVAGIFLAFIGTLGVILGLDRSIWNMLAAAISPDGMDAAALVQTLLAGQLGVFAIFAVQLWRGPALWPAILTTMILAGEFVMRVASEAGAHMVFLYMAATAYAVTSVRASWLLRRHAGLDPTGST